MINAKRQLFKWGPVDGLPVYPEYFMRAFPLFSQVFAPPWPDVLFYFSHERMICILDWQNLYAAGEKNFQKYILRTKSCKSYYQLWRHRVKTLLALTKRINADNRSSWC